MSFAKLSKYFVYIILSVLGNVSAVQPYCLDVSTLTTYLPGNKLECYGNCKHTIPGELPFVLCLKECLLFSFCSAVNYNQNSLECELVHIQGTLQTDMVIDNSEWRAVYATGIPEILAGACSNHYCLFTQKCVELTSGELECINHGILLAPGMYSDLLPNTRLYHPQGNTTITMYECTALTDPHPIESHPVARIVNGVYTRATVSCSAADCFDPTVSYEAYATVTESGIVCQRWDSDSPHSPKFFRGRSDLKNWCRLPDNIGRPWCYTTDSNTRWESCQIINCP